MHTSTHNGRAKSLRKTAVVYGVLTLFCGIFSFVYLQFSHGESSPFLIWLFAPSLFLGLIPSLLLRRARTAKRPKMVVRRLWNSAIATLSAGMLVRSVINISGRYTDYDMIYWVAAGLFFLAAAVYYFRRTTPVRTMQIAAAQQME